MTFYSGQGQVLIGKSTGTGAVPPLRYVGNTANGLKLGLSSDPLVVDDTESGMRGEALRFSKKNSATMEMELQSFVRQNLAMALWGKQVVVTGGSVTGERLASGITSGQYGALSKQNITSIASIRPAVVNNIVTDILTPGVHYKADSLGLASGTIKFMDVGTFVQPFVVDYVAGDSYSLPMFNAVPGNWWVRFIGLNTADSNEPVMVDLYNVRFDPLKEFLLKSDGVAGMQMTGTAMLDLDAAVSLGPDSELSYFGHVTVLK
jgi:hypothetical protein